MKIDLDQKDKSRFFITHHKAGSVFCLSLLRDLEPYTKLKVVDPLLTNWLSKKPLEEPDRLKTYTFESVGKTYMIRFYPTLLENRSIDISKILGILMIRDPRDTLVSLYFSLAFSHLKAPAEPVEVFQRQREELRKLGLNAYLQSSKFESLKEKYEAMFKFFQKKPNILWTTYEKMVTNFDLWFSEVVKHFQWQIPPEVEVSIKDKSKKSFAISQEDIYKHKRKVTPGDWKEKFSFETKEHIKQILSDTLIRLGYEKDLNW